MAASYLLLAKREEFYPEFYPTFVSLAGTCPLFSCGVGRGGSELLRSLIFVPAPFHRTGSLLRPGYNCFLYKEGP